MLPGIEKFEPLSLVDFPDPLSVELFDGQNNVVAVLRASISSEAADFACSLFDVVNYVCNAKLYSAGGITQIPVGGDATEQRVFGAYRSGNKIPVSEIYVNSFVPNNCPQSSVADSGHDIQLAGDTIRLFVESKREQPVTCPGEGGVVTVKCRGLVKRKVGDEYVHVAATEWVSRTTKWRFCNFEG